MAKYSWGMYLILGAIGVAFVLIVLWCLIAFFVDNKYSSNNGNKNKISNLFGANSASKKNILNAVFAVFTFAIFASSMVMFYIDVKEYISYINIDFQKEKAIFVEYQEGVDGVHPYYNLFYKFEAEDGTIYSGKLPAKIANYDYVQSKIGESVDIYVDYTKKEHRLNLDFNNWYCYLSGGISLLFFVLFAYSLIRIYKSLKRYAKVPQSEIDNVQTLKTKKPRFNYIVPHLIAIVVGVVVIAFCSQLLNESYAECRLYKSANFEKVEATIVYYERKVDLNGDMCFTLYYEYIAPEKTYTGIYVDHAEIEKGVEAKMGEKMQLFVDHNLCLQSRTLDFKAKNEIYFWIGIISSVLLVFNSLTKYLLYLFKLLKFNINYKRYLKYNLDY